MMCVDNHAGSQDYTPVGLNGLPPLVQIICQKLHTNKLTVTMLPRSGGDRQGEMRKQTL